MGLIISTYSTQNARMGTLNICHSWHRHSASVSYFCCLYFIYCTFQLLPSCSRCWSAATMAGDDDDVNMKQIWFQNSNSSCSWASQDMNSFIEYIGLEICWEGEYFVIMCCTTCTNWGVYSRYRCLEITRVIFTLLVSYSGL